MVWVAQMLLRMCFKNRVSQLGVEHELTAPIEPFISLQLVLNRWINVERTTLIVSALTGGP